MIYNMNIWNYTNSIFLLVLFLELTIVSFSRLNHVSFYATIHVTQYFFCPVAKLIYNNMNKYEYFWLERALRCPTCILSCLFSFPTKLITAKRKFIKLYFWTIASPWVNSTYTFMNIFMFIEIFIFPVVFNEIRMMTTI